MKIITGNNKVFNFNQLSGHIQVLGTHHQISIADSSIVLNIMGSNNRITIYATKAKVTICGHHNYLEFLNKCEVNYGVSGCENKIVIRQQSTRNAWKTMYDNGQRNQVNNISLDFIQEYSNLFENQNQNQAQQNESKNQILCSGNRREQAENIQQNQNARNQQPILMQPALFQDAILQLYEPRQRRTPRFLTSPRNYSPSNNRRDHSNNNRIRPLILIDRSIHENINSAVQNAEVTRRLNRRNEAREFMRQARQGFDQLFGDRSNSLRSSFDDIDGIQSSQIFGQKNNFQLLPTSIHSGKSLKCTICYDSIRKKQKIMFLFCLHGFHAQCCIKWLKTKPTCPVCNFDVAKQLKQEKNRHY